MPTPQIKDEEMYRALRREGNSEEKSARIAKDLKQRAREIGIKGRSSMSKAQLISALRDH